MAMYSSKAPFLASSLPVDLLDGLYRGQPRLGDSVGGLRSGYLLLFGDLDHPAHNFVDALCLLPGLLRVVRITDPRRNVYNASGVYQIVGRV